MPLFYQHNINGFTKLGIWKIEEEEAFFLRQVPLSRAVTHPHKRLQHLAGRYLLPFLYPDFPLSEIIIADTRKPFLENEQYHFSISHCGGYAAAIVSPVHRVGVDVELISPKVEQIAGKFLHQRERDMLEGWGHLPTLYLQLLTILWSAKESVYKWYGLGLVDFKHHIQLQPGGLIVNPDETVQMSFTFSKDTVVPLKVEAKVFGELVLAWLVS